VADAVDGTAEDEILNAFVAVGAYTVDAYDWRQHAFAYSDATGFTYIDVPGSEWTSPTGVNNHGEISGIYGYSGDTMGFVRGTDGSLTLLSGSGGGNLYIDGLNDSLTLTGMYGNRGLIAELSDAPEPATWALAGAALLAMLFRPSLKWRAGVLR